MNPIHTHHLLSAMYAQSLDGIFFMMLDEPIHWHDSVDKEAVLDYVLTHHRITDGNAAFYTQHRTRPDKLKGLTPLDFFPDRAEVRKRWRTFLDEEHIHLEIELTRLDGSPLLVEGDYSWLKDDHGAYIGSFGIQRDITEKKQIERKLLDNQARYDALFHQRHDAVYILDLQGRHVAANRRASEMLGYSLEELHTISYLETSGERDASEAVLRRLRAGELVPTYKRIFIKKSGERFPVEINVELVRDSEGTPLYLQSTVRDISRREALQNELARRAANAEAMNRIVDACLVNETLDPIFERALAELAQLFAVDGGLGWTPSTFVSLNLPAATSLFRVNTEEYRLPISERTVVEDWSTLADAEPKIQSMAQRAIECGIRATLMVPLVEGERRIGALVLANSQPRHWSPEEVTFVEEVGLQMSMAIERLHLKAALRASEERYRVLSEMLSDYACVTRVDADKSIHLEWEREGALTPLTGYSREELIEMGGPGGIILPEDRPTAVLQWSPNMPAEDAEFRIRHKDGSIRWLHRVCQGEQSQDPRVVGRLYETLRDVTERKDLEKRSLALAVEQERSRILSNFIRDASHEFRTPLSIINLNVYTLKRFLTNEEHLKRLETVAQQIRAMNDLVDSLLNLSRVDSVTDLSRAPLNVNALLVLTHEPYRVHATEKALSFELVLHPSLPQISGNIDYLTIAISKLLDNAVRYTSEGQIIARTLPDHSHVVIEVQDTGLGMSPETQERIFERFFRLDDARSERGFGLGLPLAQRIVELHGGHICVTSEEGKGTTFRIYLPIVQP